MKTHTTDQLRTEYFYESSTLLDMAKFTVSCQCSVCRGIIWFNTRYKSEIPDAVRCPYCFRATLTSG